MTPFSIEDYFTTRPWIDLPNPPIEKVIRSHGFPKHYGPLLEQWHRNGYVILRQAAPQRLLSEFKKNFDSIISNPQLFSPLVLHEHLGYVRTDQMPRAEINHPRNRFTDLHRESYAGKKLALLPTIVDFLKSVFLDRVIAMQSLSFKYGSENPIHQDICVVVSGEPTYLAASWVALEDVHVDAGPVGVYPGSHRMPLFEFDGTPFTTNKQNDNLAYFEYLRHEVRQYGDAVKILLKQGDVLIWHGALAHEGLKVNDDKRTRYSFVCHYTAVKSYPMDRRDPKSRSRRFTLGRGSLFELSRDYKVENIFPKEWYRPLTWKFKTKRLMRKIYYRLPNNFDPSEVT